MYGLEGSRSNYQVTGHCIPETRIPQLRRWKNLKKKKLFAFFKLQITRYNERRIMKNIWVIRNAVSIKIQY
jgi:hypothetical protein